KPLIQVENVQRQQEGVGPFQPPLGFVVMPVLWDTFARIFNFMNGMFKAATMPSYSVGSRIKDGG
uniref:hypothetical protein n=1 Tax=Acinetobacter baumannii TaxID=470 RepID=UPI0033911999